MIMICLNKSRKMVEVVNVNKYEELLQQASDAGVRVYTAPLSDHDGLYSDGVILISDSLRTTAEKTCVLAEELAHHYTACGDITGTSALAIKQEIQGRRAAHEILVPIEKLVEALTSGFCRSRYELAEYLEVTEEFLNEALEQYRLKYGPYVKVEGVLLFFSPFGVLKSIPKDLNK